MPSRIPSAPDRDRVTRSHLPALARVHHLVGIALEWCGWHGGAAQAYRDALRIEPSFVRAHFRLGESLARSGRWQEASESFAEAARLSPTNVEAQGNFVLALHRAHLRPQLVDALYRLTELRPREGELFMLLGAVLRQAGRIDEAIRAFRWAVRLAPAPPSQRFFLGEAILGPGEWQRTLASWADGRNLEPGVPVYDAGRSPLHAHPGGPLEGEAGRPRPSRRKRATERTSISMRSFAATLAAEDRVRTILHGFREKGSVAGKATGHRAARRGKA